MVPLQALLIGLSCAVFYVYAIHRYLIHRLCSNIPSLQGELPLIGHLGRTKFNFARFDVIKETAIETEALGGISKVWLGPIPIFVITDPKIAQTISNTCLQKIYFYQFAASWVGQGIFIANVDRWKHTRKQISPSFSQKVLDSFQGVFNAQARQLVETFAPKAGAGEFVHQHFITKNMLETTCQTTLGLSKDNKSIVDDKYMRTVDQIFKIIMSRVNTIWLHLDWVYKWTSLKREEEKLVKIIKGESMKLIKLRKAANESDPKIENGESQLHEVSLKIGLKMNLSKINGHEFMTYDPDKANRFKTFLELLLELKDHFSEEEMGHEVGTIIVGGYDTSASTLMLYLVVIGSYPEVQAKVRDELKQVFGDSKRDVTKKDLGQLVYLEATLKEVIRLYPIGPASIRTALEDVKLDNCTIPSGSHIFLNIWGLNRSKVWGPDADEFRPERWLDPSTLPECPAAFAAFGIGRRSCLGRNYAMMNMKTTLAHLLRHYIFKGDETKLRFDFALLLKATAGNSISLESQADNTIMPITQHDDV